MAVSRGKMLGRYVHGGCDSYKCHLCHHDPEQTRWRKRQEEREVAAEVEEELAGMAHRKWRCTNCDEVFTDDLADAIHSDTEAVRWHCWSLAVPLSPEQAG